MGTLYLDRKEMLVKLDGNALGFFLNGNKEGIVPINPLKRVIVVGNVTLEAAVLRKLAESDISVIFLSGRRTRFCGMLHGRLHQNGLLRLKQYEKSLGPFPRDFSARIVTSKLSAQSDLLREALDAKPELGVYLRPVLDVMEKTMGKLIDPALPIDSVRGLEGGASSAYFSVYVRLFPDSLNFKRRNRRPPGDPVNALLSLCYTLLHFEMVREIEVIGLDPTIGFYHQFDYGRESLACDLVEDCRPSVDRLVWTVFRERQFTDRDFSSDNERPGCYLKKESRKRFYPVYEEWAQEMRPRFAETARDLARRIMGQ